VGLWVTPGTLAHTGERILHRRTFSLPSGTVTGAVLLLAGDDEVEEVWVNEVLVGNTVGTPSDTLVTINVPQSALIPGATNLLAFKVHDTGGGGHDVQYKLTIN
jgi:hypothetical protein